ncbi:IS3 family transposase [Arthrobacter castelli]|uniref:IS3 family transposase n=1 Tax=Arthrobacter castelli TaxID=271431 RepID=UPI0003F74349|nr:IS3 family transposase [Arthrobacter castelli]
MIYTAIAGWADEGEFSIRFMCEYLGVSKSGYYRWFSGEESDHDRWDRQLTVMISDYFTRQKGRVGARAVQAWLARSEVATSVKRVWRLMRQAGLVCCHPRPRRQTTIADPDAPKVADLIGRDFTAGAPDQRWVGDITYIRVGTGWVYLATVIDLFSRKVVGYSVADHMRESLVEAALSNALKTRRPAAGVIFHSDRGSVYTSNDFAKFCRKNNVTRSMGRTGSCYDNAAAESFFATIKKELIYRKPWTRLNEVRKEVFEYVEIYYNRKRLHSTLDYVTPNEYEIAYKNNGKIAA